MPQTTRTGISSRTTSGDYGGSERLVPWSENRRRAMAERGMTFYATRMSETEMAQATKILSVIKNQDMDKAVGLLMRDLGQALLYANVSSEGGETQLTVKGRAGKSVTVARDSAGYLAVSTGRATVDFEHPKLVDGVLVAADGSSALVWLSKLVVETLESAATEQD